MKDCFVLRFNLENAVNPDTKDRTGALAAMFDIKKEELEESAVYYENRLKVDETIEKLELNESELKVLDCLISGKSLSETARTISCGVSTVFDSRNKLQKKYLSLVNN